MEIGKGKSSKSFHFMQFNSIQINSSNWFGIDEDSDNNNNDDDD